MNWNIGDIVEYNGDLYRIIDIFQERVLFRGRTISGGSSKTKFTLTIQQINNQNVTLKVDSEDVD